MEKGDVGGFFNQTFLAATFTNAEQLSCVDDTLSSIGFLMPMSALKPEGWNLEQPEVMALMEKLRKAGISLGKYVHGRFYYGIKTGLNEAFVIDGATRERLIAEDPKSEELIKPWLRGRDIKKWRAEWAGLYVIFTRRGVDIEKYPAIKRYLDQFREDLEPKTSEKQKRGRKPGSYKWYEIQDNIAYYEEFEQSKIIYPNITKTNIFAFDSTGILANQKCFIIPTNDLYLLAVLNSRIGTLWFLHTLPLLRGAFFEPSAIFMQQFPIAKITDKQKAPIITLVNQILSTKKQHTPQSPLDRGEAAGDIPSKKRGQGVCSNADTSALEKQIDKLVYKLYDLTPDEIEIVEGKENIPLKR